MYVSVQNTCVWRCVWLCVCVCVPSLEPGRWKESLYSNIPSAAWRELTGELRFWAFLKLKVQRVYEDWKSKILDIFSKWEEQRDFLKVSRVVLEIGRRKGERRRPCCWAPGQDFLSEFPYLNWAYPALICLHADSELWLLFGWQFCFS